MTTIPVWTKLVRLSLHDLSDVIPNITFLLDLLDGVVKLPVPGHLRGGVTKVHWRDKEGSEERVSKGDVRGGEARRGEERKTYCAADDGTRSLHSTNQIEGISEGRPGEEREGGRETKTNLP